MVHHWGLQSLFRKPSGIPSRFSERVKQREAASSDQPGDVSWLDAAARILGSKQVSAAVTDGIITHNRVSLSFHALQTLIKTCHACFSLQTEAALEQDRQSFRQSFFQLSAEIISTEGKETQELPDQVRSVFHHVLHHSPVHSPFQKLWGNVTEPALLECCGVKVPEGKCGWCVNSLPTTRKIKNWLCLESRLLRQKGMRSSVLWSVTEGRGRERWSFSLTLAGSSYMKLQQQHPHEAKHSNKYSQHHVLRLRCKTNVNLNSCFPVFKQPVFQAGRICAIWLSLLQDLKAGYSARDICAFLGGLERCESPDCAFPRHLWLGGQKGGFSPWRERSNWISEKKTQLF